MWVRGISIYAIYSRYFIRQSSGISHVDKTCRVQTIKREFNKNYYDLIKEFYKLTDIPMVMNTSLNLAGDTIVETVDDALNTLKNSEIDHMYFPEIGTLI